VEYRSDCSTRLAGALLEVVVKKGLLVVALAVLLIPSAARAGTVSLVDWQTGDFAINAGGGGGPFQATTSDLGTFLTFCIEFNEHVVYGKTYDYALSQRAYNGGVAGADTAPPYGDPVSDATKWLYYMAVSGGYAPVLQDASVGGASVNLLRSGVYFQNAIWYLEEERQKTDIASADRTVSLNLATRAVNVMAAAGGWAAYRAANNLGEVWAMNVTVVGTGAPVQDQLVYIPTPEPGTLALTLAGVAILAVGARTRYLRVAE